MSSQQKPIRPLPALLGGLCASSLLACALDTAPIASRSSDPLAIVGNQMADAAGQSAPSTDPNGDQGLDRDAAVEDSVMASAGNVGSEAPVSELDAAAAWDQGAVPSLDTTPDPNAPLTDEPLNDADGGGIPEGTDPLPAGPDLPMREVDMDTAELGASEATMPSQDEPAPVANAPSPASAVTSPTGEEDDPSGTSPDESAETDSDDAAPYDEPDEDDYDEDDLEVSDDDDLDEEGSEETASEVDDDDDKKKRSKKKKGRGRRNRGRN